MAYRRYDVKHVSVACTNIYITTQKHIKPEILSSLRYHISKQFELYSPDFLNKNNLHQSRL